MNTARLLVRICQAWLDVRVLRWRASKNHPYRVAHGERASMPGYRRRGH